MTDTNKPNFSDIFSDFSHAISERIDYERGQLSRLAISHGATHQDCADAINVDRAIITRTLLRTKKEAHE